jgi:hypothetical protein
MENNIIEKYASTKLKFLLVNLKKDCEEIYEILTTLDINNQTRSNFIHYLYEVSNEITEFSDKYNKLFMQNTIPEDINKIIDDMVNKSTNKINELKEWDFDMQLFSRCIVPITFIFAGYSQAMKPIESWKIKQLKEEV